MRLNAEGAKLEREEAKAKEKAKTKFEKRATELKYEQKRKTLTNKHAALVKNVTDRSMVE